MPAPLWPDATGAAVDRRLRAGERRYRGKHGSSARGAMRQRATGQRAAAGEAATGGRWHRPLHIFGKHRSRFRLRPMQPDENFDVVVCDWTFWCFILRNVGLSGMAMRSL